MTADQNRLYEDLKRQYDLIADRRKTLTSQASSLLGFAGVIETILIATIVSGATDADFRDLLSKSLLYYPVLVLAAAGFGSYILTVIFSLKAYWEPKWIPAPQIPLVPKKDRFDSISHFWNNLGDYDLLTIAQQLGEGIDLNQEVNDQKFENLKKAFSWLRYGIVTSAVCGIFFLIMVI